MPLADALRPTSFDTMVGQEHLVGPHGILRKMVENNSVSSCIFYGPPGTGKTTAALILAASTSRNMVKLNAVSASSADIKQATSKPNTLLYLDEIQYFNKKQQQLLLPSVESGDVILIASTTENPYFSVYDALLSRCTVLEFKRPSQNDIAKLITTEASTPTSPLHGLNKSVIDQIAAISSGDVRRALTCAETLCLTHDPQDITEETLKEYTPSASMAGFDAHGDSHYAYISALQKSIRGSDPDAAVFWLTKLLEGGDMISPIRRLQVIAAEDIGLAYPDAMVHTLACCQVAERLGLPEAYKPLTQAALLLALAPKSNSNEPAYMTAQKDIAEGKGATVPSHLAAEHAPGYIYPHNYPNHWVAQQYLPSDIINHYYQPGNNPQEQQAIAYWKRIKGRQ